MRGKPASYCFRSSELIYKMNESVALTLSIIFDVSFMYKYTDVVIKLKYFFKYVFYYVMCINNKAALLAHNNSIIL